VYTYAKHYENWLAVDKAIAKISRLTFLAHPVRTDGYHFYATIRPPDQTQWTVAVSSGQKWHTVAMASRFTDRGIR